LAAAALAGLPGWSAAAGRPSAARLAAPAPQPHAAHRAGRYPDWPAYHGSRTRAGVSTTMPTVRGALHVLRSIPLDGAVYASPLVVHGLTIVATENDTVYAFGSGLKQLWRVHLGTPAPQSTLPCGDIDPLGITGTPVYSSRTNDIYVAAEFGGPPRHRLFAINLDTGRARISRTLDLSGVDKSAMQERGALTITGGRVWVPFGGLAGDCGAYKGRVVGYRLSGHGAPVSYTVPTAREAGIWTPPGPTVDPAGHLFVSVGNGASGVGDRYDHSDSVLKLSVHANLLDFFAPSSWASENDQDLDLGSQGPALAGRWIFITGKAGIAFVLRATHLGRIGGAVHAKANVCGGGSFGGTAVRDGVVYVPCADGVRAVRIDSAGRMHLLWQASSSIAGSPVIGGRRVWSVDAGAGVLHALSLVSGRSLEQISLGSATSRFSTPALYGHRVLIGTNAGLTVVTS
jgi:hypothetical protein